MLRRQTMALLLTAGLTMTACTSEADTSEASGSASNASPSSPGPPEPEAVRISTSSWRPGDGGHLALIRGRLAFTDQGCPFLGDMRGVVWPADYTSLVKPNGEQVIVTADGREISEGDIVIAGGAAAATKADAGMPCIEAGTTLTLIESQIEINPSP